MLEKSTLSADVAQGYALNVLSQLLQSFLSVDVIKQQHKGKLVGVVLRGYLGLKCLVIQRTKRIDDTENLLLKILEDLTSGTEEEKKQFMAECVAIMEDFSTEDLVTPIFVFERFCNVILPEKSDEVAFYLQLDKDPQQEEFLQGRMQGNPYKSSDPGTGPLMRDIKNKICTGRKKFYFIEPPLYSVDKRTTSSLSLHSVDKRTTDSLSLHSVDKRTTSSLSLHSVDKRTTSSLNFHPSNNQNGVM